MNEAILHYHWRSERRGSTPEAPSQYRKKKRKRRKIRPTPLAKKLYMEFAIQNQFFNRFSTVLKIVYYKSGGMPQNSPKQLISSSFGKISWKSGGFALRTPELWIGKAFFKDSFKFLKNVFRNPGAAATWYPGWSAFRVCPLTLRTKFLQITPLGYLYFSSAPYLRWTTCNNECDRTNSNR